MYGDGKPLVTFVRIDWEGVDIWLSRIPHVLSPSQQMDMPIRVGQSLEFVDDAWVLDGMMV